MVKLSLIMMSGCIFSMLLSFILVSNPYLVEARCPDGYHMSPSGECEKVTHTGGLPRCPDGYHRSPSGDCEQVSSGGTDNTNLRPEEDGQKESIPETTSNERFLFLKGNY